MTTRLLGSNSTSTPSSPAKGRALRSRVLNGLAWGLGFSLLACGTNDPDAEMNLTGSGGDSAMASGGASSASGGTEGGLSSGGSGYDAGGGGANGMGAGGMPQASGGASSGGATSSMGAGGQADGTGGETMASGGSDGSGGGDGGVYQPCPTSGECKILPLGDSITWGVGDEANGGYRGPLFEHFVADGKQATFTGGNQNGPNMVSGQAFPKRNEGHSGWGIAKVTTWSGGNAGIITRIPSPAFDGGSGGVPHIILLHIGTNDSNEDSFQVNGIVEDLKTLLDKLVSEAPDALIVVARIVPLGWNNPKLTGYNAEIEGIVQTRAAAGEHLLFVDMHTGFDTNTMLDVDDIHPNGSGYQFMADKWYSVIEPLLP